MGLINLGNGLSEMGNAIAQTAGQEALTAQKENLDEQRMQLANDLAGGKYDVATKALDYQMHLNQLGAIYRELGLKPPADVVNGGNTAAPPDAPTAAHVMTADSVDNAIHAAQGAADAGTSDPEASGADSRIIPSGSPKQSGGVLSSILPPGMTMDQARFMALTDPKGFSDLVQKWQEPQNVRAGSSLVGRREDGTLGPVYTQTKLPEGYTLDSYGRVIPAEGGPNAVSDIATREALGKAAGQKNVSSFDNYLETGGLGLGTPSGDVAPAPSLTGYAARVAQLESGSTPNPEPNGRSTAAGSAQFVNGTWLSEAKKFLPPAMIKGLTDDQILALRADPKASALVTDGYAIDNAKAMNSAGIKDIGAPELYLAHHFGAQAAVAILKSPVNTPIDQILTPAAMAANPDLEGKTTGEIYSVATRAMNGVGGPEMAAKPSFGNTAGVKSIIPPVSEAAPINPGSEYLKSRIPQWAKQEDDWADALPSNLNGQQRALAIADALKATQSGQWATEKADVAAKLKALGPWGESIANAPFFGDPAQVQTALKDNFASTLAQIRSFTSRPAAVEVTLAQKNFANPNLQPEANLKIIGQTVGSLQWEEALMNDWAKAKAQGWHDPQDFQRAWMEANPVQKYIDNATKEIGPLKGMVGARSGPALPAVGDIKDGYQFNGGDPSKQSSWIKVQ